MEILTSRRLSVVSLLVASACGVLAFGCGSSDGPAPSPEPPVHAPRAEGRASEAEDGGVVGRRPIPSSKGPRGGGARIAPHGDGGDVGPSSADGGTMVEDRDGGPDAEAPGDGRSESRHRARKGRRGDGVAADLGLTPELEDEAELEVGSSAVVAAPPFGPPSEPARPE